MRVRRVLDYKTPAAADNFHQPGNKVLFWRENILNNHIGEWLRLFIVLEKEESRKLFFVQEAKIRAGRPFHGSSQQLLSLSYH